MNFLCVLRIYAASEQELIVMIAYVVSMNGERLCLTGIQSESGIENMVELKKRMEERRGAAARNDQEYFKQ
jgi:hypothetical protein